MASGQSKGGERGIKEKTLGDCILSSGRAACQSESLETGRRPAGGRLEAGRAGLRLNYSILVPQA